MVGKKVFFKYKYMELAVEQARLAQKSKEVPVGAVIVNGKDIISFAHNISKDPTSHAEILVIREACRLLATSVLYNSDVYVTLEPCPMCAQAISFAKIKRLYFGAYNRKGGGIENGPRIFEYCSYSPEVYGGILETECSFLLKDFFKKMRIQEN